MINTHNRQQLVESINISRLRAATIDTITFGMKPMNVSLFRAHIVAFGDVLDACQKTYFYAKMHFVYKAVALLW